MAVSIYNSQLGVSEHPGFVSGSWYPAVPANQIGNGVTALSTRSYFIPIFIPSAVTITDLGGKVITLSAAGLFGLGIYAMHETTKRPTGTVLASVMGLSTTNANTAVSATIGDPVTFGRGWYWAAGMVNNATATFNCMQPTQSYYPNVQGSATLANVATAAASHYTSWQNTAINYASGFTSATTADASFSVVAGINIVPYFKVQ